MQKLFQIIPNQFSLFYLLLTS